MSRYCLLTNLQICLCLSVINVPTSSEFAFKKFQDFGKALHPHMINRLYFATLYHNNVRFYILKLIISFMPYDPYLAE